MLTKVTASVMLWAGFMTIAHAADYRSVNVPAAILYDAPSDKGRRVFVAPRGMPVELVLSYGAWTKVRDASGDLSWIQTGQLAPATTVVAQASPAEVRTQPEAASPILFRVNRGVLLSVTQPVQAGWLKVRHADGEEGFMRIGDVWGATR